MNLKNKLKNIESHLPIKTSLKYWDRLLGYLFDYETRSYGDLAKHTLIENPSEEITHFEKKYGYLTPGKTLVGMVTEEQEDIDTVVALLKSIPKRIQDPNLALLASMEIITKVLAYRNLSVGTKIPIYHGKTFASYRVDNIFDLWKEMRAFGLVDVKGEKGPILLFRGTDFSLFSKGGRASIITDLDPKGPGRSLYKQVKEPIKKWLEKVKHPSQKARVLGFSLGGSLASFALLANSRYFSKNPESPSFLFHSPGLPVDLFRRWRLLKQKPRVEFFVAKGDPVSKLGKLFGNASQLSIEEKLGPISAHTVLYFLKKQSKMAPIPLDKENACMHRKEFSKIHEKMSYILYKLGLKHLLPGK